MSPTCRLFTHCRSLHPQGQIAVEYIYASFHKRLTKDNMDKDNHNDQEGKSSI